MFHRSVLGVESRNLDLFLASEDTVRRIYSDYSDTASSMGGSQPNTGSPVSCSSMGRRFLASMGEDAGRPGSRWRDAAVFQPPGRRRAAGRRLRPLLTRRVSGAALASSTGRPSVSAVCHALARSVTPPSPS